MMAGAERLETTPHHTVQIESYDGQTLAGHWFECEKPQTFDEKKTLVLSNGIAMWDVIAQCEIEGSADSTIRDVTANNLSIILDNSCVDRIFVNGKTAEKYYNKYTFPKTGIKAICLPSTSPANAAWSFEKLVEAWKIIR